MYVKLINIIVSLLNVMPSIIDFYNKRGRKWLVVLFQLTVVLFCVDTCTGINFISKHVVNYYNEISEEVHNDKMRKRDNLLRDLYPILVDLRSLSDADRILYLEYHNSKENLVGIPFKFVELVAQNAAYGITPVNENSYKDINIGLVTTLYEYIKINRYAYCDGINDSKFHRRFPGCSEVFIKDGNNSNTKQLFVSIPGVKQPIGMIILEWTDRGDSIECNPDINKITQAVDRNYMSRINGLILSNK